MALYVNIPAVSGVAQWFVDQFDFVKSKVPSVDWQMPFSSECMGLGDATLGTVGGTGGFDPSQTRSGGWWRSFTGTMTGSTQVAYQRDGGGTGAPAVPARIVANARTKPWATGCRVVIVSLPGGTNANDALYPCNLLDGTNDNGLHLIGATSQVNWAFGVGSVWADTGVAVDTGVVYDLVVINDTTNVKGYVDGVEVGSAASSGIASAAGVLRWYCFNIALVNHEFQLDRVMGMTAIETA